MVIRKKLFTGKVVRHWNSLPRVVVVSLALTALNRHLDVVFRDMV